MLYKASERDKKQVALLTEGVDRNILPGVFVHTRSCRPPHGGRG